MREETIRIFQYDELSEDAKEKALEWYCSGGLDDFWSENIIEDAKESADLNITDWDTDQYCRGDFYNDAKTSAEAILKNHGADCETYKTAAAFLAEYKKLPKDDDDDFENEDDADALESEFLRFLLEDYRIMLRQEMEYQESREVIEDNIRANEHEFMVSGKRY